MAAEEKARNAKGSEMTQSDDIEGLLTAVRSLISSRSAQGKSPLVLTEDQRIVAPEPSPDGDGYVLPKGDAVLQDFARLTLARAPEPDDQSIAATEETLKADLPTEAKEKTGEGEEADAHEAPVGVGDDQSDKEPDDLAALRELVREVFREEVRSRFGKKINENIQRIVEHELDKRLGPPSAG